LKNFDETVVHVCRVLSGDLVKKRYHLFVRDSGAQVYPEPKFNVVDRDEPSFLDQLAVLVDRRVKILDDVQKIVAGNEVIEVVL